MAEGDLDKRWVLARRRLPNDIRSHVIFEMPMTNSDSAGDSSAGTEGAEARLARLEAQLEQAREDKAAAERALEDLQTKQGLAIGAGARAAKAGARVFLGRGLDDAVGAVLRRLYSREWPHQDEAGGLILATMRRWIGFGALKGLLLLAGGIVGGAVAWMTLLEMRRQSQEISIQSLAVLDTNTFFQRQIELQAEQDYRTRKAQLLDTLWSAEREGFWPWESQAEVPSAPIQSRSAALHALAELERGGGPWCAGIVKLNGVNLATLSGDGLDLEGANLSDADLARTNLNDASLTDANLARSNFLNANLWRANLMRADLTDANLQGAHLTEANLTGAILWGADLTNSLLLGANLADTGLQRASLARADLREADFSNADLSGATLKSADLTGAILENVRWDAKTIWPDGFTPPPSTR